MAEQMETKLSAESRDQLIGPLQNIVGKILIYNVDKFPIRPLPSVMPWSSARTHHKVVPGTSVPGTMFCMQEWPIEWRVSG